VALVARARDCEGCVLEAAAVALVARARDCEASVLATPLGPAGRIRGGVGARGDAPVLVDGARLRDATACMHRAPRAGVGRDPQLRGDRLGALVVSFDHVSRVSASVGVVAALRRVLAAHRSRASADRAAEHAKCPAGSRGEARDATVWLAS
jgi:hypothetical protein